MCQSFKNFTIILGDSNTKHLNFSGGQRQEKGAFGYRLPGERIETFHIHDIDEKKCIGFQNIIVHCGINDIRDNSPGHNPTDPDPEDIESHVKNLITKICDIKQMCPYASLIVSPILYSIYLLEMLNSTSKLLNSMVYFLIFFLTMLEQKV